MAKRRAGGGTGGGAAAAVAAAVPPPATEGTRMAESLVDTAEEQIEQLEKRLGSPRAEVHLGPAPESAPCEEATIWYYAYGSNINKKVFEGRRMIKPTKSLPAVLPGWQLRFTQPGLPYREPCFAAVEPRPPATADAAANGASTSGGGSSSSGGEDAGWPDCHGVAHLITPSQWAYVLETEGASGQSDDHGYAVVELPAVAYDGQQLTVQTLTVLPKIKARLKGRQAQPSLRYLTLIRDGAVEHGLTPEYRRWLGTLQHYEATTVGQRVGSLLFTGAAFVLIFPVWAGVRLLRRFTGMKAANGDAVSRFMGRWTATMFQGVHLLHELLRPLLGCGLQVGK